MKPDKPIGCNLCNRDVFLTFHHLVPKKYQDNKVVLSNFEGIELIHYGSWLCNDCHKHVHKTISLHELAFNFNSIEKLKGHEDVAKFGRWAAKQTKKIKR